MVGLVLDIETTGYLETNFENFVKVTAPGHDILEVGYIMIDMDTNAFLNTGTLYFYKPEFEIENKAQEIHGLTREFLKQYEDDFDKNLIALNAMIQHAIIIGKNSASFDVPYIQAFINKYSHGLYNIEALSSRLSMKAYNGGYVYFNNYYKNVDMQKIWSPKFKELYLKKTGFTTTKRGTLGEYIDMLNARDIVDELYNNIPNKARTTGAHGALYDCVMTYIVYLDARLSNMIDATGEVIG